LYRLADQLLDRRAQRPRLFRGALRPRSPRGTRWPRESRRPAHAMTFRFMEHVPRCRDNGGATTAPAAREYREFAAQRSRHNHNNVTPRGWALPPVVGAGGKRKRISLVVGAPGPPAAALS